MSFINKIEIPLIDATNQNQLVECPSCSILLYIEDIDDED